MNCSQQSIHEECLLTGGEKYFHNLALLEIGLDKTSDQIGRLDDSFNFYVTSITKLYLEPVVSGSLS